MCKKGWYAGLGQERCCLREGGRNCLKYLYWNRKGGGNLGQGMDALKRGLESTYILWYNELKVTKC